MLLRDRFHHVFEERVPVRRLQRGIVFPVHFELAVGILVIVLIRLPAERDHAVADFGDDFVAAHQRLLVVARLGLGIGAVGNRLAVRLDQKIFAFDAGLQLIALPPRPWSTTRLSTCRGFCATGLPSMIRSPVTQATSGFHGN